MVVESCSFFSKDWVALGIDHRVTYPHTSEQNGSIESRLRKAIEGGMASLVQGALPVKFWNYEF